MNKKIFKVGVVALIVDQITKLFIDMFVETEEVVEIINNFFYITKVSNTGAAFSILEGRIFFLTIISLVCIILLIKLVSEFKINKRTVLSFGLLFGGILGNFSDRLFLGHVRDFLKFNIFGYHFPIFNIADSCIVVGVMLLIIGIFRGDEVNGNSCKRNRRIDKNR